MKIINKKKKDHPALLGDIQVYSKNNIDFNELENFYKQYNYDYIIFNKITEDLH